MRDITKGVAERAIGMAGVPRCEHRNGVPPCPDCSPDDRAKAVECPVPKTTYCNGYKCGNGEWLGNDGITTVPCPVCNTKRWASALVEAVVR